MIPSMLIVGDARSFAHFWSEENFSAASTAHLEAMLDSCDLIYIDTFILCNFNEAFL